MLLLRLKKFLLLQSIKGRKAREACTRVGRQRALMTGDEALAGRH